MLENSGIKDYDGDGKLEYMSGSAQKIELKFIVCSDSSAKTGVVRKFASDMETLGLTVNVQELTWENYIQALEDGDFDMYYGEVKLRNNFDVTELLDPDSDLNYSLREGQQLCRIYKRLSWPPGIPRALPCSSAVPVYRRDRLAHFHRL